VGKKITLINVPAGAIRPSYVPRLAGALIAPLGVGAGGVLLAIIPAGLDALININAGEAVTHKPIVTIAAKTTAGVGAGRLRVAGVLSRVLALIHIAAKRSAALVATLTRAGKTTRRVGADPVSVTIIDIFRTLIDVNARRSTEDVPHTTKAGAHAGVGLIVVAVVTGLRRIGHPIPARRLHAGAATRVRGCVGVVGACVAGLTRGFVQNPIPAALKGAIGVAKVGLAATITGFTGVHHLVAATSQRAIGPAGVRIGVGVGLGIVTDLIPLNGTVAADTIHAHPNAQPTAGGGVTKIALPTRWIAGPELRRGVLRRGCPTPARAGPHQKKPHHNKPS
jgi:hypothetical protein